MKGYSGVGYQALREMVLRARVAGKTYQQIATALNDARLPKINGNKRWTTGDVWSICQTNNLSQSRFRRCQRCNLRGTTSHASKYCATCKDEVREEQIREYQRKAYAKKHPRAGE